MRVKHSFIWPKKMLILVLVKDTDPRVFEIKLKLGSISSVAEVFLIKNIRQVVGSWKFGEMKLVIELNETSNNRF